MRPHLADVTGKAIARLYVYVGGVGAKRIIIVPRDLACRTDIGCVHAEILGIPGLCVLTQHVRKSGKGATMAADMID